MEGMGSSPIVGKTQQKITFQMKIKVKTKHGTTLTKHNVSADRRNELYKDLQSKTTSSNLVEYYLQKNEISMNHILPYRLTMDLKKKERSVRSREYRYKKKKVFKQIIFLRQFLNAVRQLWYLMKAYTKINRVISVWHKQIIQNEFYSLQTLTDKKLQIIQILAAYKQFQKKKTKIQSSSSFLLCKSSWTIYEIN